MFLCFSCSTSDGLRLLSNVDIFLVLRFDMVFHACLLLGMTEASKNMPPPIAATPKPTSNMVETVPLSCGGIQLNKAFIASVPVLSM